MRKKNYFRRLRPLVVGQGRERVAIVDANDTGGDRLHVGGVGLKRGNGDENGDEESIPLLERGRRRLVHIAD